MAVDSSEIIVTQLKMAPATMPEDIMGTVILKKVFIFVLPRDRAASSMVMGIWCKIATEERIV